MFFIMPQIILNLTPELQKRINAWSLEMKQPPENLALGLLDEYFEDSDTGAEISAKVSADEMSVLDWNFAKSELNGLEN